MIKRHGNGQLKPLAKRLNRQALIRRAERLIIRKSIREGKEY